MHKSKGIHKFSHNQTATLNISEIFQEHNRGRVCYAQTSCCIKVAFWGSTALLKTNSIKSGFLEILRKFQIENLQIGYSVELLCTVDFGTLEV